MTSSETEHAVIASFDSSAQAEQAANDLLDWEKTNPDINLGPIGVVTKNTKGDLQTKSYRPPNTGKGAKIGVGVGVAAAVFSGGLTLIPTVIGGAVVGAAAGSLSHKRLRLTGTEGQQLNSGLDRGCAALLVMCNDAEVKAIADYLTLEGGRTLSKPVEHANLEAGAEGGDAASEKPSGTEN